MESITKAHDRTRDIDLCSTSCQCVVIGKLDNQVSSTTLNKQEAGCVVCREDSHITGCGVASINSTYTRGKAVVRESTEDDVTACGGNSANSTSAGCKRKEPVETRCGSWMNRNHQHQQKLQRCCADGIHRIQRGIGVLDKRRLQYQRLQLHCSSEGRHQHHLDGQAVGTCSTSRSTIRKGNGVITLVAINNGGDVSTSRHCHRADGVITLLTPDGGTRETITSTS